MDSDTVRLFTITSALVFLTIQAWLTGNDMKDVALLVVQSTAAGFGAAVVAGC